MVLLHAGRMVGHSVAGAFQPGFYDCDAGAAGAAAAVAVLVAVLVEPAMPVNCRLHVIAAQAADGMLVMTPVHPTNWWSGLQHVEPRCDPISRLRAAAAMFQG